MPKSNKSQIPPKFLSLFTIMFLSACLYVPATIVPGVKGTIKDSVTHLPINNASVRITVSSAYKALNPDVQEAGKTVTDANGYFEIPTDRKWRTAFMGVEGPNKFQRLEATVTIDSAGYSTFQKVLHWGAEINDLGVVEVSHDD